MHDLYYKGRIHTRVNHVKSGYGSKKIAKLGTHENPLTLNVADEARKVEIETLLVANDLVAAISVNAQQPEDIVELNTLLNKPVTTTFEKTPNRNDPCVCGSGKKYKKCCG